jgi:4-alpha-glucanotransferase
MHVGACTTLQDHDRCDHGGVSEPDHLVQRARHAGIVTDYDDWQGNRVEVPADTLAAILDVLDQPPSADEVEPAQAGEWAADAVPGARAAGAGAGAAKTGAAIAAEAAEADALSAYPAPEADGGGERPVMPSGRQWGFTVQLYSVRSRQSWGHGDLHDLAELARWSGAELGAGFVLVNPLHAAEPLPPVSASPYLPMTRLFTSPLYLRVEDIPEYAALPAADKAAIDRLAAPLRAANNTPYLIDRDAVWTAKRHALQLISKVPLAAPRQTAYESFRAGRGRRLQQWSDWCALAERYGADWRDWPPELTRPTEAARAVAGDPQLAAAAEFHSWLQWHADQQLAAAQHAARAAGMAHGIIHDLAVGVHPGGADAWAMQGLLVPGFSVGAPPDGFNQLGQDWSQPPWHPRRLAAAHYQPLAELFDATLRHGGGIRVDHVMGLMRLWWIPAGQPPDRGAYVRYDHQASVGELARAAGRADAVAIGEDLGTIDRWVSDYLASRDILGTMMLWFARARDGTPLPPARWRRACMATVGTHDVPPVSGFVTGDQVTVRAELGLLKASQERERAEAAAMLAGWQAAARAEGLLTPGQQPDPAQFTVALYAYLRKTPALLLGVSLADAVGDRRTQNIPGTSSEYPNWQIPLCDGQGKPVLLEELPRIGLLREVCTAAGASEPAAPAG